jgi:drug/metabolite transporter (DMT)-like permease
VSGLLAIAAAVSYGTADFFGGAAARRQTALAILLVSTPVGLLTMVAAAGLTGGQPTATGLLWGAAAGTFGGTGVMLFYHALAVGPMSVVAPVSALTAALLPVAVALATGERPATLVLVGVALCLVAIALVSREKKTKPATTPAPGAEPVPGAATAVEAGDAAGGAGGAAHTTRRGVVFAIVAGAGFGLFFVLVHHAGAGTGMWPLVTARGAGWVVAVVAAVATATKLPRGRVTLAMALCSGVLDAGGNALYLLASRAGDLTVAAVLTSLYPAVTVLLARLRYRETLRTVQKVGLVVAAVAVVLTAAG